MERIVHSAVSISKPKPTEINVTKPTPNLVTEAIVIEKPRHIEISVAKGSVGVNGRNGLDGRNGIDGINGVNGIDGKDGGTFIPSVENGKLSWTFATEVDESQYPAPTNVFANIESITNSEIYYIVSSRG